MQLQNESEIIREYNEEKLVSILADLDKIYEQIDKYEVRDIYNVRLIKNNKQMLISDKEDVL